MVNFLFLVDTSYVMNSKVGEYGLTLLELCKTAIHRSVNNRRKSMSKPTDNTNNTKFNHKYLLVTYSSSSAVQCGWDNSTDYFLKSIESLEANDKPNFGASLSTAFRLLQSNPNQLLTYGNGWQSWHSEMNVIIILSYCIDANTKCTKRNEILNLEKRTLNGDEFESDYIQWNTRIFVGNINVFGTLHIDTNPIRDSLNNLCLETSPTDALHVINNELHSLTQIERWITAIMRDNSRDGVMIEIWDSSKEDTNDDEVKHAKFNDGQLFREFIIPMHCDMKWPIPENYSPKEHTERTKSKSHHHDLKHELPSRGCRPQIAVSRAQKNAACLPRSEWNVPYEQYEITSPRLRDFLLNLGPNSCYYAYIEFSAGSKFNFAKPWGTFKGDPKRNKAFLYVFVYDFPFVWNQISVFLQAKKRNFHNFSSDEWKRAVAAYLNFIPCYYVQSVKDLLMQITKGVHLPSVSSYGLEPSIASYINEVQRKWRGNTDYKVKLVNNDMKHDEDGDVMMDIDKTEDIVMDNDHDSEEFHLCGFPLNHDDDDDDDNVLLNAIYKKRIHNDNAHKDDDDNDDGLNDLMELPFVVNARKRNWSQQHTVDEDKDTVYNHTRKRRRLFHHTMDIQRVDTHKDVELISSDTNIGDLMKDLRVSIFGDDEDAKAHTKIQKIRNDSFDVSLDTKTLDIDIQNKLLSTFASKHDMTLHDNNASISPTKIFNDPFIRNRVSVYGHNDAHSWKYQYKLIFDQKEADKQHVEKHNNMGNYTMYAEKLKLFKKDEFRNPFQTETEYSNYALSLSFIFFQEKINEYNQNKQENNTQTRVRPKSRSYLETEMKLKSNKLLSIQEIVAIKKQTSEAIWTKNEISTTFYDTLDEEEIHKTRNDLKEYRHSLLKSSDWLSAQVLHNLKPTNLGGNPFKKRRKKSPFPSVLKPRIINTNRNKNNAQMEKQLQQKKQQSKFEQEVASTLPPIAAITNGETEEENTKIDIKCKSDDDKHPSPLPSPSPSPSYSPPPKPKKVAPKAPVILDVASNTNTNGNTKAAIHIKSNKIQNKVLKKVIPPPPKPPKIIKPKIDINRVIESVKRKQKTRQRPTQILPMKRRPNTSNTSSSNSSTHSHSHSHSPSISPIAMEPATKKQKLSNGVNGNNIKMKGNEMSNHHHTLNHYNHKLDKKQKISLNTNANANIIRIVNTNSNYNNHYNGNQMMNGHTVYHKRQTVESQTVNILSFMEKYREMVRSPKVFDHVWFENGLQCLNGLAIDTKNGFYQLLMNEAKTYNRYQLAQSIQQLSKNI